MNKFSVGEIVLVDLDPSKGHEQKKTRPCLVINVHPRLDLLTVFSITDSKGKSGKIFVEIKDYRSAGLTKSSVIDTYQIRTLSAERIAKRLGKVSDNEIFSCRRSIALIYEIDEEHLV